jgi:short-subunit dehydrogenase
MSSRVIVIVGASSGIGRATAHQLAAAGEHLVLCSRGKPALDATAEECRAAGAASVAVLPVDVTDGAAVADVIASVVQEHGRIDAVIHSAGVVAYGRFEEIPAEVFDGVVNINLHGAANVAREVLPILRSQREGSLVLVGSVIGNIAAPTMTPYAVSKYAVRSLGRQLALENRDLPDVHISVVSPGSVDTPIYKQAANFSRHAGRPPAPVGSADSVARAIVKTLDQPRDRVSVGLANPLMRAGFSLLPRAFDAMVGPLFSLAAAKPGNQSPTTGNVLGAHTDTEAVSGGEGQGLGDLVGRLRGR